MYKLGSTNKPTSSDFCHYPVFNLNCRWWSSLCILLLVACNPVQREAQPQSRTYAQPLSPQVRPSASEIPIEQYSVEQLIDRANSSPSPEREKWVLAAAERALQNQQPNYSQQLLDQMNPQVLTVKLQGVYLQISVQTLLAQHQPSAAIDLLTTDPLNILPELSAEQQINLQTLKAQAYEASGHYLAAARERQLLHSSLLTEQDQQSNIEAIWQNINQLPTSMLQVLSDTVPNPQIQGWIELVLVNRNYAQSLSEQLMGVRAWQSRWPHHIAAYSLPTSLQALETAMTSQANHIAVLLPKSGPYSTAANAIREGLLLAYFQDNLNQRKPHMTFIDTASEHNIKELYDQALLEGAEVIIGPLDKEKLAELASHPGLPVPVLGLNYLPQIPPKNTNRVPLDTDTSETLEQLDHQHHATAIDVSSLQTTAAAMEQPSLFQFGLAAEDEAQQISQRARSEEHLVAGILFPNTDWGHRVSQSFADHWLAFGGLIANQHAYEKGEDYSKMIRQFLAVDQSQSRAQQLENLIGNPIEFTPRRRQDLDFIVLLGNADQARLFKPILNYYFAQDLPIYSTSTVFTGIPNPEKDADLNHIIFTDIPWVMTEEDPLKSQMVNPVSESARLVALGIDSYRLYPRLSIFAEQPGTYMNGATGLLMLDPYQKQRFIRQSTWARFVNGVPRVDMLTESAY